MAGRHGVTAVLLFLFRSMTLPKHTGSSLRPTFKDHVRVLQIKEAERLLERSACVFPGAVGRER